MDDAVEKLERAQAQSLNDILGNSFKVLNDGFVRVVDYMGSDSSIVQAARVSYGAGTKQVQEDRGLIRYLMRHRHTTPFEMCEIKLHVRVPMDCWRQWIRHRTASVNEYSTRYSVAIDSAQITSKNEWRLQSLANKQGSSSNLDPVAGQGLSLSEERLHRLSRETYDERIALGVAREQARKDLPLSTYTEAYWKIDLHNLFHFLALRMDSHAQQEIRAYATTIGTEIVKRWCPIAWQAFVDFRLESSAFSRIEYQIISALIRGNHDEAVQLARQHELIKTDEPLRPNRERQELEAKLQSLSLSIPWGET